MRKTNLYFLITQQTITQYNENGIFYLFWCQWLTFTWLKSPTLLLSCGLIGLVSTLGLTTCRKGLESGSPLTLIPSGNRINKITFACLMLHFIPTNLYPCYQRERKHAKRNTNILYKEAKQKVKIIILYFSLEAKKTQMGIHLKFSEGHRKGR